MTIKLLASLAIAGSLLWPPSPSAASPGGLAPGAPGYLGVGVYEPGPRDPDGLLVAVIEPGSPAEEAGLQVGWRILAVNARFASSFRTLVDELRDTSASEVAATILVRRSDAWRDVDELLVDVRGTARRQEADRQSLRPDGSKSHLWVRHWTDSTGRAHADAALVGVDASGVRLHKTSGSVITVPLARLSLADQQYVEAWLAQPPPAPVATSEPNLPKPKPPPQPPPPPPEPQPALPADENATRPRQSSPLPVAAQPSIRAPADQPHVAIADLPPRLAAAAQAPAVATMMPPVAAATRPARSDPPLINLNDLTAALLLAAFCVFIYAAAMRQRGSRPF